MRLIEEIARGWAWAGLKPTEIVGENDFGNLIIKDIAGSYWRLCPEGLCCNRVANNRAELDALSQNQEFLQDWYMESLVRKARYKLGPLRPGYKYCLKTPSVLGGQYEENNMAIISLHELVAISGYLAKEIDDLPNGAQIRLNVAD